MHSRFLVIIATGATVLVIISVTYGIMHRQSDVNPAPLAVLADEDRQAIAEGVKLRPSTSHPAAPKSRVVDSFSMGRDSNAATKP